MIFPMILLDLEWKRTSAHFNEKEQELQDLKDRGASQENLAEHDDSCVLLKDLVRQIEDEWAFGKDFIARHREFVSLSDKVQMELLKKRWGYHDRMASHANGLVETLTAEDPGNRDQHEILKMQSLALEHEQKMEQTEKRIAILKNQMSSNIVNKWLKFVDDSLVNDIAAAIKAAPAYLQLLQQREYNCFDKWVHVITGCVSKAEKDAFENAKMHAAILKQRKADAEARKKRNEEEVKEQMTAMRNDLKILYRRVRTHYRYLWQVDDSDPEEAKQLRQLQEHKDLQETFPEGKLSHMGPDTIQVLLRRFYICHNNYNSILFLASHRHHVAVSQDWDRRISQSHWEHPYLNVAKNQPFDMSCEDMGWGSR